MVPGPVLTYRHEVAALGRPLQREQTYVCGNCGWALESGANHPGAIPFPAGGAGARKAHPMRTLVMFRDNAGGLANVGYAAVRVADTRQVLPKREGTIQDGTVVDQYGDPELMARFAVQYMEAFRAVMPYGRTPTSLVETMPALHLLVMAVELVLKADLMRSGKNPGKQHRLEHLYEALDESHRQEAEARFGRCDENARLAGVGERGPQMVDVLRVYDRSYGGASQVYLDTRYYAESTEKFSESSGLKGANLSKSQTPYPIFLPQVAESLIAMFGFFEGAARLQRRGGEVRRGTRARVKGNHGEWGFVPASLGLLAVQVRQADRMDAPRAELAEFTRWREDRPAGYVASWAYGGSMLLFYPAVEEAPTDGETDIDGIDCRIWHRERLGMHSRDLYGLADALEGDGRLKPLQV